jgi:hypothetical protein
MASVRSARLPALSRYYPLRPTKVLQMLKRAITRASISVVRYEPATEVSMLGMIRISATLKSITPCFWYQNEADIAEKIMIARLVPIAVFVSSPKIRVSEGTYRKPPPSPMMAAMTPIPSEIRYAA